MLSKLDLYSQTENLLFIVIYDYLWISKKGDWIVVNSFDVIQALNTWGQVCEHNEKEGKKV